MSSRTPCISREATGPSFLRSSSIRFDFGNALGASRDRMLGTVAGAVLAVSFLALARLWSIPGFLLLAAIIIPLSFLSALRPQYRTALSYVNYRPVSRRVGHDTPCCCHWTGPRSGPWRFHRRPLFIHPLVREASRGRSRSCCKDHPVVSASFAPFPQAGR